MLFLFVKLILVCQYASLRLCSSEATENISIPAVMAFGDSFVDSGNNNFLKTVAKANFVPYGKDFMGGKPTGRFANGKTLADYTVDKLGVKESLPAYLDSSLQDEDIVTGVSFGSGSTGYDPLTAKLINVFSLPDQIEMFKEYIVKLKGIVGEEKANDIIQKSLYLISVGTNDFTISYTAIPIRRIQYTEPAYANFLVQKATTFIQDLYKLGARRIVIFNTPAIGCLPVARTVAGGLIRKCSDKFNENVQTFNKMLNSQIQLLGSNLPQSRFTIVDYFGIVQDIIQHPLQYGLEVVDKGCCGTGTVEVAVLCNKFSPLCLDDTKYLFWDSVHLTDKAYNIVIDHALQNITNTLL